MHEVKIRLQNIKQIFEGKTVLQVDDLTIQKGSFCGIIGPNGAGKSTLLNIVAGLNLPSSGCVMYGGEEKCDFPGRDLTMVFQSPYLIRTTAEKNIAYPLKLRGWPEERIQERVLQLAAELGLSDHLKQKAWTLSAGESQKVALARALSFHPQLLLLDEPTANIDPATTEELERMLLKINREEGTTVLMITHNLPQAKRICDHVIFIYEGVVTETGATETVLREPKHPLTQRFVQGELLI
jgi:tungstate transport system ATP-binding protein